MLLSELVPQCGIYIFKCLINDRVYIGKSNYIIYRWTQHIANFLRNMHDNAEFSKDVLLYGLESFDANILELCDISELKEKEKMYIYEYEKNGYNLYNIADRTKYLLELGQDENLIKNKTKFLKRKKNKNVEYNENEIEEIKKLKLKKDIDYEIRNNKIIYSRKIR
jgi:group I intron endonuclease